MNRRRSRFSMLAWLAVGGMCFPAGAVADRPPRTANVTAANAWRMVDVELQPGGLFVGQLVDTAAQPMAGVEVSILAGGTPIASTRTDQNGVFAIQELHGGVHQIEAGETGRICRLWAPGTAPPSAIPALQLVEAADFVRGQWGPPPGGEFGRMVKSWGTNPFVIGGIVAAAVAIPVAAKNADEDSNS